MPEEFRDEEVSGGASRSGGRRVREETMDGQIIDREQSNQVEDEVFDPSHFGLKESTQKLLDKLEEGDGGPGDPDDPEVQEQAAVEEQKPEEQKPEEQKPPEEPKPSEIDTVRAENARLAEFNRRLVAEAQARENNKPAPQELSARQKKLDEAERLYLDDPIAAWRLFTSVVLGIDDVAHKDLDAELSGFYTDLTSRELDVPLQQAHKASREAVRAKQMLARDRRERQAESEAAKAKAEAPPEDADAKQAAEVGSQIQNFMTTSALGEKYPLLMNLSSDLDGLPPGMLVWRVLQRETKAGTIASGTDTDMVEAACRIIENHYQVVSEKFAKAKPIKQDTAKGGTPPPPPAPANKASTEQRRGAGTRTITNASAGVAPATPPKPAAPPEGKQQPAVRQRGDKRGREAVLDKYFPNDRS